MRTYKVLTQPKFSNNDLTLVPLRFEDRYKIMDWRNEQMYHLRQKNLLTSQDQDEYFINVVSKLFELDKPDQLLFSILKNDVCIGYGGLVHIDWINMKGEISMIMATSLEQMYFIQIWEEFLGIIKDIAMNAGIIEIYTYAYDVRPDLYVALERSGFSLFNRILKEVKREEKNIDVVQHYFRINE
jgi:hypothetical protein